MPATAPTDGGKAPAQRQHPVDAHADQPGHLRILRRRAHGEAQRRVAEEHEQQASTTRVTSTTPSWCGPITPAMPKLALGERRGELLDQVAPDRARDRVADRQQADEDHDDRQHRRVVQRSQDHALDQHAQHEGERHGDDERDPEAQAPAHQLPGDVGREHRHLALGEIDVVGRHVDHHQRQRHAGIDRAVGEAGRDLLEELFHVCCLSSRGRTCGCSRRSSRPPRVPTSRPGRSPARRRGRRVRAPARRSARPAACSPSPPR